MPEVNITVVIPVKNRANTIGYCLNSVISQTSPASEIIVVDDHSTDDTETVVRGYASMGVKYFRNNLHGAQAARNYGIHKAEHEWIAFQDSDDKWVPSKLARQKDIIQMSNYSKTTVIHTGGFRVDVASNNRSIIETDIFEGDCYSKLLLSSGPMFPSLLVHKDAIAKIGFLDENCPSFQEWDTSIRLAREFQFVHLREPLFEWICHSNETISKDRKRDITGHLYIINKYRDEIQRVHGQSGWMDAVTNLVCKMMYFHFYDDAIVLSAMSLPPVTNQLVNIFSKLKFFPKGGRRILRVSTRI